MVGKRRRETRRAWLRLAGSGLLAFASRAVWAEIPAGSRSSLALQEWHGVFGGKAAKLLRMVTRAADWEGIWRSLGKPEPARFIEGSHGAVVADLGTRPTGGYGISAVGAEIGDRRVRLVLAEVKPGKDQFVIQALTQPWAVFLLEIKGRELNAVWAAE